MDGPDHEQGAKTIPFQDLLYSPIEHEDLSSISSNHSAERAAEEWLSSDFTVPQNAQPLAVNEPVQPLLEVPVQVTPLSAQVAHQVAGDLRQYSTLWETYKEEKAASEHIEKENEELRVANLNLMEEQGLLERRHAEQEALIAYYGQIFDKVRFGILGLIKNWEGSSMKSTLENVETSHEDGRWDS